MTFASWIVLILLRTLLEGKYSVCHAAYFIFSLLSEILLEKYEADFLKRKDEDS